MKKRFCRHAVLASLLAVSGSTLAAAIPQVSVSVTDTQCEPMSLTVQAGKTQFLIKNNSQKALEWEILKGNKHCRPLEC